MRRNCQLVFRNPRGRVDRISASTFAVSCHGAGLYAQHDYPLGSEVFLMDSQSGVGAWGKLVWEGRPMRDGRVPVGVEFSHPGNYWKTHLIPRSWVPFIGEAGEQPSHLKSYLHPSIDKVVLVGNQLVESGNASRRPARREGEICRCCGGLEEVSVGPMPMPEPLCRVCREWAA